MAYQFHPGQKIQFVGHSVPGKHVQTGDIGEFVSYEPDPTQPIDLILFSMAKRRNLVCVRTNFHGRRWNCEANEIRPVDDGAQPGSFDECVWKPEAEKA